MTEGPWHVLKKKYRILLAAICLCHVSVADHPMRKTTNMDASQWILRLTSLSFCQSLPPRKQQVAPLLAKGQGPKGWLEFWEI